MSATHLPGPNKVLCLMAWCRGQDMPRSIVQTCIEVPEASTKVLPQLPPETFAFRFVEFDSSAFRVFGAFADPLRASRRSDLYYYKLSTRTSQKLIDSVRGPATEWVRNHPDIGFVAKVTDDILFPVGEHEHIYNEVNFGMNPYFKLRSTKPQPDLVTA